MKEITTIIKERNRQDNDRLKSLSELMQRIMELKATKRGLTLW